MTKDQDSLSRLTLRQLRHEASDLGVPLYSRKSKAALVKEISLYKKKKEEKEKQEKQAKQFVPFWRAPEKSQSDFNSESPAKNSSRVVFLPRDPKWAYVFWEISESDREKALAKGASKLCLRLADVTGLDDGTANKQILQEVPVDSHSTEWYLPIPMSDRDYRIEIGYRYKNLWTSLAFSSVARVPSLYPSDQILDQFVPFSLEAPSSGDSSVLSTNVVTETKDTGLHERLYQTATKHIRSTRIGSEEFHEHGLTHSGLNDSGSGLWASGRNESGLGGIAPDKSSFWLVADAELILYGSTDPSAKLTIGGEDVPLSSDGTFRLQVPFRDGIQNYPIKAVDADRGQMRNITMKFERITPVDNTNPSDQAKSEWF